MIVISKFSSLYFGKKETWKSFFDTDVCYIQKYAENEEIRIQFIGEAASFTASYSDVYGNATALNVQQIYTDAGGKRLFEIVFSVGGAGVYELSVESAIDHISTFFKIEAIENLSHTILLRYTHRRNEYDTVFINGSGRNVWFNFRVDGGIYPGDKSQAVENDTFRDQRFVSHQLSSESYEVSVLKAGSAKGVPQWAGNRINNIFKLSDALVDGIATKRNEGSAAEIVQVGSYYPLYVFKLNVEQPDTEIVYTGDDTGGGGGSGDMIIARDGTPIVTRGGSYITAH